MNRFDDAGMSGYPEFERIEAKEINILDYWRVVWRRKWTVFAFAFVVLAVVTIRTFTTTPTYTASGTLLIEKEPNILTFEELFQIETLRDDYLQTQYKLLKSRNVADVAVDRLKLYENKEFIGEPKKGKAAVDKSDPLVRRNLVDAFLGRLEVEPVRQTRLVDVSFKAQNPKFAAEALNTFFEAYIDWNIEVKYAATEQATEFLTNQIKALTAEIERKERELQNYGAAKNIIALSDKETTIIDKLGELNKALTEAQIDRIKKQAYYNEIKIASPDYIPASMTNPLITRLREDYVRFQREYTKMQEKFRPDYPEMKRLTTELESAKEALETETQNLIKGAYSDYQAALKKEKSLEEVFNAQKKEAIQLNSSAILYNSLKIEIENKKNMLESLLRRQSETGVAARLRGLRTSNIQIVNMAEIPLSPSSPKKKLNLILALLVGLMGGLGLAFVFEYLDNSVKSSEDVEKYAGVPALGIVPTFSVDGFKKGYGYGYGRKGKRKEKKLKKGNKGDRGAVEDKGDDGDKRDVTKMKEYPADKKKPRIQSIELIPYFSPKSNYSESYRSIRTALLLSSAEQKLKCIAVSSALPLEGKTATVSNLGVTLAQTGKKVIVVDSDLRKPKLHKIFKIKNLNGLTNYLTLGLEIKKLIKPTEVQNLFIINSGPVPPNPAELLGSEKMKSLVNALKETFDYVLFDSPPILAVSDAMVLDSNLDGMILIVRGEKTSREALKRAKEKLDLMKIKTLGVVINNLNIKKHAYYYKHYYYQQYYGEAEDRL